MFIRLEKPITERAEIQETAMITRIELDEIDVEVVQKNIRNIHLTVHPPAGKVRISAPLRMNMDAIRNFAVSKIDWIRKQQKKIRDRSRNIPESDIDNNIRYVWGRPYGLNVIEYDAAPLIDLGDSITLRVRPGTDDKSKEAMLNSWYRYLIRESAPALISKWEPVIGVRVTRFFVQKMKTRWGSCNITAGSIRLNSDLAKKPPECLEYVVVHEMVHLLERSHNSRFKGFMDLFLPEWRDLRVALNRLMVVNVV